VTELDICGGSYLSITRLPTGLCGDVVMELNDLSMLSNEDET